MLVDQVRLIHLYEVCLVLTMIVIVAACLESVLINKEGPGKAALSLYLFCMVGIIY